MSMGARTQDPFDASDVNISRVRCVVCNQTILQGRWFQRLSREGKVLAVCSPYCANEFESNPDRYINEASRRAR
jgi:YHS domain-containing protein